MTKIKKINKSFILKFEDRNIQLSNELKEKIEKFWNDAIKENPNLYNGQDYTVESFVETNEEIKMTVIKTKYNHYLYNERIGILDEKDKAWALWGGILLITSDNYFVTGEMDATTSFPYGIQIPGGGIDIKDIDDDLIDINKTIKRELKEELNLDLNEIDYKIEFVEVPVKNSISYGFLAVGKTKLTKKELNNLFKKYKEYLVQNNFEVEFNKLVFIKKDNALDELKQLPNPKRFYLNDLIKETLRYY